MGSPAGHEDAPDRCAAHQTWLPGAEIDPVLELEKAFDTGRIDVVRNRRSAQRDCLLEDSLQGGVQAVKFGSLQVASHSPRPDSGAEEALIGIDIAHSVQQLLIQQGGLDGCAAATK